MRRLESGHYQVRKMVDGISKSITFDHKPTQREVNDAFAKLFKDKCTLKGTFKDYAEEYLEIKSNVLSPTTIINYKSILRNLSCAFLALRFDHLDASDIQREINTYAVGKSPKSVKNASGFITTVCRTYRPDMTINTKLPQSVRIDTYIPTDSEVNMLVEEIKGSPYEAVILLMLHGLRKSEAISITAADINNNILTIDKASVVNEDGIYREKTTKTETSTREIYIPPYLANLICQNGCAYQGFPGNILRYLHRTQDKLGINRCKLHALRHYYVSKAHSLGVPDATIAKSVGHSNIATTQRIYTHPQSDKQTDYEVKVSKSIINI